MSPSPPWRAAARLRFAAVLLLVVHPLWIATLALDPATRGDPRLVWLPWLPLVWIHGVIPLADAWLPADGGRPIDGPTPRAWALLPVLCLPAWGLALACGVLAAPHLPTLGLLGLLLSLGATGGVLAINPAHEMIHRPQRWQRAAGGLLLAAVGYGAWMIEHVRGHHTHVATPRDPASARRGESVYAFVPRSILGTLVSAWRLEALRLRRLGRRPVDPRNEWLWLAAGSIAVGAAAWAAAGPLGALVFVAASLGAIVELEIVNYIEHYGLERARLPDGRWAPVGTEHSWNANTPVTNAFLFNLQRHSDHHAHAGKDWLHLDSVPQAPQLPGSYGAMVLLALVPPLWRRAIDPRLPPASAAAHRPQHHGPR